jgi:hypothetical protein
MTILKTVRGTAKITFLSAAVALAAGAGLTFASFDITGGNCTTGPNSLNRNVWDVVETTDVVLNNDVTADNIFDLTANTGRNTIDLNTLAGDVMTGDVEGDIDLENDFSLPQVDFVGFSSSNDDSFDLTNELTGPNSENRNRVTVTRDSQLRVNNTADFTNDIIVNANTGVNTVSDNTEVGDVRTGDVDITGRVENSADFGSNFDVADLSFGSGEVNADLSNEITGPNSVNTNVLDVTETTDTRINNTATVDNVIDLTANTGRNDITDNTVVCDVETGSVNFDFQVVNNIN